MSFDRRDEIPMEIPIGTSKPGNRFSGKIGNSHGCLRHFLPWFRKPRDGLRGDRENPYGPLSVGLDPGTLFEKLNYILYPFASG